MLSEQLSQHIARLQSQIASLQEQIAAAPSGTLHACQERNSFRYYKIDPDSIGRTYLGKDSLPLAAQLAQKEFDLCLLNILKEELQTACTFQEYLDTNRKLDAFNQLSPARRVLVSCPTMSDSEYSAAWAALEYQRMPVDESGFSTANGERVRSKSEVIIANALFNAGIPYHYECPLQLENNVVVHPDFTILNTRTREVFFWEHFGMMDDDAYRRSALKKLALYAKSRIVSNRQFLTTFEGSNSPLDTDIISHYIDEILL